MIARKPHRVLALACVGVLSVAGAAAASTTKSPPTAAPAPPPAASKAPAAPAPNGLRATAVAGYTVVSSGSLDSPAGTQERGTVTCPSGTVPLGGGVFVESSSVLANVNSSFPSAGGWVGDVNNASADDTTFDVRAVCGFRPQHYSVRTSKTVRNPSGRETTATVSCPSGSRILSGGALSSSSDVFVNLNSSFPFGHGWAVAENNASFANAKVTAFAVCARLPGTTIVTGGAETAFANDQTFAPAVCPSGFLPVGGGVFAGVRSVGVNINTTVPDGDRWDVYVNNASAVDFSVQPYVICTLAAV